MLIEELTRVARWEKYDGRAKSFVKCDPPTLVARVLAALGAAAGVGRADPARRCGPMARYSLNPLRPRYAPVLYAGPRVADATHSGEAKPSRCQTGPKNS
jgi:hypothetical protein